MPPDSSFCPAEAVMTSDLDRWPSMWNFCSQRRLVHHKKLTFPPFLFIPDIDECTANSHQCNPTQVCINTAGGYTCSCTEGYWLVGGQCQGEWHELNIKFKHLLSIISPGFMQRILIVSVLLEIKTEKSPHTRS